MNYKAELIPIRNLTSRESDVLKRMIDGEELVFSKGAGWYIGENKTSGRLVNNLLRYVSITEDWLARAGFQKSLRETGAFTIQIDEHTLLIIYLQTGKYSFFDISNGDEVKSWDNRII